MIEPSPIADHSAAMEDAELVRWALQGDTTAQGRLVAKYQDRVVNLCWRMCGHLDDAQDLAQEAFVHALQRLNQYRFEAAFYTWLFRIAINECLAHRRKSKRVTLSLHRDMSSTSDSQGPMSRLIANEMRDELAEALGRLDDDQRAVIVLRDIEGLDYQQISDVLEISVGTVKSRLHRERLALREMLLANQSATARSR